MSAFPSRLSSVFALFVLAIARLAVAESEAGNTTNATSAPASGESRSITENMSCSACHTTTGWRAQGAASAGGKFDHSTTGFPLTGAHVDTPCVGCHGESRPVQRACVSCHEDFHRGRLSQSCDRCHSPAGWRMTRAIEIHRATRLPLTGMHVLADCTECHRRAGADRWVGVPVTCFSCHEKDYRRPGIFPVHAGSATTAPLPRDCSLCHRPVAWVPAAGLGAPGTGTTAAALQAAPRDHDLRFPISFGVHRTATCDDCHTSSATPRAVRCIGCHAHDPATIIAQHRQPVSTEGAACMSCHLRGARR